MTVDGTSAADGKAEALGITLDHVERKAWELTGWRGKADEMDRLLEVVQGYAENVAGRPVERLRGVSEGDGLGEGEKAAQGGVESFQVEDAVTEPVAVMVDAVDETWKWIPGYEGLYQASDYGRVRSFKCGRDGKLLKPRLDRYGYLLLGLSVDGQQKTHLVHHLVAKTFLGEIPEGQETRHLNGDSVDNRLENLAYGTRAENAQDKIRHGTAGGPPAKNREKTHCKNGHEFTPENTRIRSEGWRVCRTCEGVYNNKLAAHNSAMKDLLDYVRENPQAYGGDCIMLGGPQHNAGDGDRAPSAVQEEGVVTGHPPFTGNNSGIPGENSSEEPRGGTSQVSTPESGVTEQRCSACKIVKAREGFARDATRKSGLRRRCRSCEKVARSLLRQKGR